MVPHQGIDLENPPLSRLIEALEQPIAMSFAVETPMDDVLEYIKQATTTAAYSGVQIYIDPIGLAEADKSASSPVIYESEGLPLGRSLRELLAKLGLDYEVREDRINCDHLEGGGGGVVEALSHRSF